MFSGIVEEAATVTAVAHDGGNMHLTLRCGFVDELKIDQSVSHNGVCLTVVSLPGDGTYTVTAVRETLAQISARWSRARLSISSAPCVSTAASTAI